MRAESRRSRALLLRAVDYGERDRIVTLLTETWGRVSALARGLRGQRTRGGLRDVPALVLLDVALVPGRGELDRLREVEALRDFPALRADWRRAQQAGSALGWLRERLAPRVPEPELFAAAMELLEQAERSRRPEALGLAFRLRALALLGAAPQLGRCVRCGRPAPPGRAADFDPAAGGLACQRCGGAAIRLSGAERAWMARCAGARWWEAEPPPGELKGPWTAVERFAARHLAHEPGASG